jgi:hypothetical protein
MAWLMALAWIQVARSHGPRVRIRHGSSLARRLFIPTISEDIFAKCSINCLSFSVWCLEKF